MKSNVVKLVKPTKRPVKRKQGSPSTRPSINMDDRRLAVKVREEIDALKVHDRAGDERRIQIGTTLLETKKRMGTGAFWIWFIDQVQRSRKDAEGMMRNASAPDPKAATKAERERQRLKSARYVAAGKLDGIPSKTEIEIGTIDPSLPHIDFTGETDGDPVSAEFIDKISCEPQKPRRKARQKMRLVDSVLDIIFNTLTEDEREEFHQRYMAQLQENAI